MEREREYKSEPEPQTRQRDRGTPQQGKGNEQGAMEHGRERTRKDLTPATKLLRGDRRLTGHVIWKAKQSRRRDKEARKPLNKAPTQAVKGGHGKKGRGGVMVKRAIERHT